MSFLAELWQFMRVRKKYWLLPIVVMMALFGGLIVLTQGSAVAPFIYTVFEQAADAHPCLRRSTTTAQRRCRRRAGRRRPGGARFTRRSTTPGFPERGRTASPKGGIDLDQVDHVVFYDKP